MLAELVQSLFKNGVEIADARHKAAERVSLHPTGRIGEMIRLAPGSDPLTVSATRKAVQTVELCDFAVATHRLIERSQAGATPVFVSRDGGAKFLFDSHELAVRLTAPLRLSEAWQMLPDMADPMDPRDLLKRFQLYYRSGFNETAWKRFRTGFRSLQASRKLAKTSSAAGYDRSVQNEVRLGDDTLSIDDFEILNIAIPVLNVPGLNLKPASVELTLNIDPDSVTVGYEISTDAIRRAEDDAVAQVVAYLRAAFSQAGIETPVLTGDGSLLFADTPVSKS